MADEATSAKPSASFTVFALLFPRSFNGRAPKSSRGHNKGKPKMAWHQTEPS
jgi:hypothetical protein